MNARINITSIGRAAAELQLPVAVIRSTASELAIAPHRINGVDHYDDGDLSRIDQHVRSGAPTLAANGAGERGS